MRVRRLKKLFLRGHEITDVIYGGGGGILNGMAPDNFPGKITLVKSF